MDFRVTWDQRKSQWNRKERGLGFDIAEQVFYDPNVRFREVRVDEEGRERIHAVGMTPKGDVLLVVFTEEISEQEVHYHIISARFAEPHEERFYFAGP